MNVFEKIYGLVNSNPKKKAVKLLEKCADAGDFEAQQMINLYRALQAQEYSPIKDNISILKNPQTMSKLIDCLTQEDKPKKKKRTTRRKRRARNPRKPDKKS